MNFVQNFRIFSDEDIPGYYWPQNHEVDQTDLVGVATEFNSI